MPRLIQFEGFLKAMYKDSGLKNRIILCAFLLLVVPAAFVSAAGVPEKFTSIAVAALVFPLEIGVFMFSERKKKQAKINAWAQRKGAQITITEPSFDHVGMVELIEKLKLQGGSISTTDLRMEVIKPSQVALRELVLDPHLGSGAILAVSESLIITRIEMQRKQTPVLPIGQAGQVPCAPALASV